MPRLYYQSGIGSAHEIDRRIGNNQQPVHDANVARNPAGVPGRVQVKRRVVRDVCAWMWTARRWSGTVDGEPLKIAVTAPITDD